MKKLIALFLSSLLALITIPALAMTAQEIADHLDRSSYNSTPDAVYWEAFDRTNPVPFGSMIWYKSSPIDKAEAYVEMKVLEVLRGEEANKLAISKNRYNDEPGEGEEYIYVKIGVSMQSSDANRKIKTSSYGFNFVGSTGLVYKRDLAAGFDDEVAMFAGAAGELEFSQIIKVDDVPLLLYDDSVWFNLTETTTEETSTP